MKNNFTILFIFLYAPFLMAQISQEKTISGQIIADSNPVEGINITNTKSKISTVSNNNGNFSITVKQGDILSFSAANYEPLRKYINKQEFVFGSIVINMVPLTIELKEVIVNTHPEITAENLGIIPRGQIKLTSAERKLATATSSVMSIDGLINSISGRTKKLKKALAVEKKEFLIVKLENLFEDKYYIETLKIPEDQIRSFQFYCVEDADLGNALNAKNKTMCMFLITGLASNYNKIRVFDTIEN